MYIRELKDITGAVFSPKVSTDSVYLSGSKTNLTTKLSNIDSHTGNSDIHITSSEKTSWNNKYDKPSSGIPKTDLASGVQTSLGKADTAWQNPSNTTTTINGTLFFNGGDQNGASKINLGANGQITRDTATILGFQNTNRLDVGSTSYPVNIRTSSLSYNGNNFASSTSPTANWGETVTVGTVAGTELKFTMPANPSSAGGNYLPLSGGTCTGNIYAPGFYVSSLRSLKENIEPTKIKATDLINSQEIVDFNYKADKDKVHKVGLIADDSDPLFLDKKGETVDLYNICGILMKAVQELSARVKELESKIN